MREYKIETHAHTSPASGCARVSATETVAIYANFGYDGLTITNHFNEGYIKDKKNITSSDVDNFMRDFFITLEEGQKRGVKIYFGAEIKFNHASDEFLIFGIDKDFFLDMPNMFSTNSETVKHYANSRGACIFQAHPFRSGMTVSKPGQVDGIEAFNNNPRHNSRNDEAILYAGQNGMIALSGSDFHQPEDIGAGIISESLPNDDFELAKLLLNGNFKFINK